MAHQAAPAAGMAGTRGEACLTPGTARNIGLAGERALVTQLHRPGDARGLPWRPHFSSPSPTMATAVLSQSALGVPRTRVSHAPVAAPFTGGRSAASTRRRLGSGDRRVKTAVEMTSLRKAKSASHRDLEISHRTRDSHIPTSRSPSVLKKTEEEEQHHKKDGATRRHIHRPLASRCAGHTADRQEYSVANRQESLTSISRRAPARRPLEQSFSDCAQRSAISSPAESEQNYQRDCGIR